MIAASRPPSTARADVSSDDRGLTPDVALVASLGVLVFAGAWVAWGSRGTIPDYDAVAYLHDAWRLHRGVTPDGFLSALPFTNTLDVLLVATLWNGADFHVVVWAIHSVYLIAFAWAARRLLGPAAALFLVGWCAAQGYFLHQYTSFISELKVGLWLVVFAAALFAPDASRHVRLIFGSALVLLLLRTLDLAFVLALCAAFAAIRLRDGWRAREIARVLAGPFAAVALLAPLIVPEIVRLAGYVRDATGRTGRNWADMSAIHGKADLLAAYVRGLGEYNVAFQMAALMALSVVARRILTGRRDTLSALRDPAVATGAVCATLLLAATTNIQVVFWPFALEGLLAMVLARTLLSRRLFVGLACALALWGGVQAARNVLAWQAGMHRDAPAQALARQMAAILAPMPDAVFFENFGGYGPADLPGLEIAADRDLVSTGDPLSYSPDLATYLAAFDRANVAFIANRPFLWPRYWGINRHTTQLHDAIAERARSQGWRRVERLTYGGDPSRSVDVYQRGDARAAR